MARLSDNRIAWQYHADDGKVYRVAANKAYTDQAKQGGEAWAGVVGPKPGTIKMRRITCRNAANAVSRVVPVYDVGAAILTAGETINLNLGADSFSFVSSGSPIAEQRPRSSVTEQST